MNHQEKIFQYMEASEFYPHPVSKIEQRETHISKVFLTGTYVYKIKKSVNLEFLDYTTLEKRNHYCHQETTLNRRLSHNIYFEEGIYSKGAGSLTYGKLLLLAREEIEKGDSVILDATFSNSHQRSEALRLARDMDANIVFVECLSPANLSKARLVKRRAGTSVSNARIRHFEERSDIIIRCSTLDVRCWMFSLFNVRCWTFIF